MAKMSGGELLAHCLANENIRFLFALPDDHYDMLLGSLEKYGIRHVAVRHEAAAVHMAEGVYKSSGEVAAVAFGPGPGAANGLPGVITAQFEGTPVFVLTGQLRKGVIYPSSPAVFQGQDQLDLYRPSVKWGGPIFAWERIPEIVRSAFREMWRGRPGPVHVDVSIDIDEESGDREAVSIWPPHGYRAPYPRPAGEDLQAAAALLARARRPLVVAGVGADRSGANAELVEIVELLNCPVVTSWAGRASLPCDHDNYVYGLGKAGDLVKREADVVLVVGSRLGLLDLPTDSHWGDPRDQKIIQIDIDPRSIGVTREVTLPILADAKATLEGLIDLLAGCKRDGKLRGGTSANLARYRKEAREYWDQEMSVVQEWAGPGIHPAHSIEKVGKVFGSEAIYSLDGGQTAMWGTWFLPPSAPRSYLEADEFGMLGAGIPQAIGAKLANPEREVVCVTGDGAAGFYFMEMQSAVREAAKITTVVHAEGSWTMEEPTQRLLFNGRTIGCQQGPVRWDKVAEGLGCHGEFVEHLEDLEPALERARAAEVAAVVCVKTDHDANLALPQDLDARFAEVYTGAQEALDEF